MHLPPIFIKFSKSVLLYYIYIYDNIIFVFVLIKGHKQLTKNRTWQQLMRYYWLQVFVGRLCYLSTHIIQDE